MRHELSSGGERLKVAITTNGRFHVLDLARELDALGHDVRFYSNVPCERTSRFGLPRRCHRGLLPVLWPLVAWERLRSGLLPATRERLMCFALNRAVIARLERCDVFIGMSGLILEAAHYARREYGARIYLERASRHILSQKKILSAVPGATRPSDYYVQRELAGYELADRIVVPSKQVAESFLESDPEIAPKLFVNPYGVDLKQFPARDRLPEGQKTILYVGGWAFQKGVDVLTAAMKQLPEVRLLHVGAPGDVAFQADPQIVHCGHVPQWRLKNYYAKAHVFVLPSRQDGFGLVLAQALASGLPIVCTDRTGGVDLAHSPALSERIRIVPHNDPNALAEALREGLQDASAALPLADSDRDHLSWRHYGERYANELRAQPPRSSENGLQSEVAMESARLQPTVSAVGGTMIERKVA